MHDAVEFFGDPGQLGLFPSRLVAEAAYRVRKRRRKLLGSGFCADYGSDLLLIMFLDHGGEKGLTVDLASSELEAPASVIQRWMNLLIDRNLAVLKRELDSQERYAISELGKFVINDSSDLLRLT